MDLFELKREQHKLARKIELRDLPTIKTIGGASCVVVNDKILAVVVTCSYPDMKLLEKKSYLLSDPLPYKQGFLAYREMPAILEAYNSLEQEPDLMLVLGNGILHPRKLGIASHLGLALNMPTIGIAQKLIQGRVEKGNVIVDRDILGLEIKTREYANPIYASPGNLVSLGSILRTIPKTIQPPHKLPEPLHLAHKIARKKSKKLKDD